LAVKRKKILKSGLIPIAINAKTGKPARNPRNQPVIYGFKKGKKIFPFEMSPQKFAKTDLKDLNSFTRQSKIDSPKDLDRNYFFEVPTLTNLKDEKGKVRKRTYFDEGIKREKILKETKIKFKIPKSRKLKGKKRDPIYRRVIFKGLKKRRCSGC